MVELRQDWYATVLHGERTMPASCRDPHGSRRRRRVEFVDELADADVEATHRGVWDRDTAADLVTSEVPVEALADPAASAADRLALTGHHEG